MPVHTDGAAAQFGKLATTRRPERAPPPYRNERGTARAVEVHAQPALQLLHALLTHTGSTEYHDEPPTRLHTPENGFGQI